MRQIKIFGVVLILVVLLTALLGYSAAGWEGAQNGAVWGLVMMAFALPALAIFILARYWGSYAGRWGSARRGEEPKASAEEEDLPPYKFE
ncbi:MAG: hypothetical protein VB108_00165 [Anaerolineaceae bacterium]|nr:hypothetical protein [Anaerolineaceae bacterium]